MEADYSMHLDRLGNSQRQTRALTEADKGTHRGRLRDTCTNADLGTHRGTVGHSQK